MSIEKLNLIAEQIKDKKILGTARYTREIESKLNEVIEVVNMLLEHELKKGSIRAKQND